MLALLAGAPLALLGRRADRFVEVANERLALFAEEALRRHHPHAAVRLNLSGLAMPFAIAALLAPAGAWRGRQLAVTRLLQAAPGPRRPAPRRLVGLLRAGLRRRRQGAAGPRRAGVIFAVARGGGAAGRHGACGWRRDHPRCRTRAHVFWRCLFLQAAWNRRGMQNLGFAYAIEPALDALYADPARREEALARHLGFFNCHPYMAAAILGGAIHHEERVAAGAGAGRGAALLQGDAAGAAGRGRRRLLLDRAAPLLRRRGGARGAGCPAGRRWWRRWCSTTLVHLSLRVGALPRRLPAGRRRGRAHRPAVAAARGRPAPGGRRGALRRGGRRRWRCAAGGGAVPAEPAAVLVVAAAAGAGYLALARGAPLFPAAYLAAVLGTLVAAVTGWDGRP